MDYARNILQKYGWKEGRGLGKDEKGISKPLRCGLKFDKAGIGYNERVSEDTKNQWWVQMFNKAAANIPANHANENESKLSRGSELMKINALTDEELFKACGGRTAHKAARHGFRLSGKLKRVREQEQMTEEPEASSEHVDIPKKKSKLSSIGDSGENQNGEKTQRNLTKKKKKKKKKKKSRRIAECDAGTIVADSSSPVRIVADGDFAHFVEEASECATDGDDHSDHHTKKKKSKNVKELIPSSVITDSAFPVETGQGSDHPHPRKKRRKSVSGTEEITKSETTNDSNSRKFKRKKFPS